MPKFSKTFIDNVEKQLSARDMNRTKLAGAMGLAKPNITQLLREETNPKLEMIEAVADALGVPPWELLRPEGASPTPQVREHTLADCKRAVDAALERQIAADAEKRREADATAKEPEKEKEK